MVSQLFAFVVGVMIAGAAAFEDGTVVFWTTDYGLTRTGFGGPGIGLNLASLIGPFCAFLLVINRLVWRFRISGGIGYDDWAIIIAWIFLVAQSVFTILAVEYGYGTDSTFVPYEKVEKALLFFYIMQILYKVTINAVKISVLSLYIRVFSRRWIRVVCMLGIIMCILAMLAFIFTTMFQCVPVQCAYIPWDPPANVVRINMAAFWKANAIWNISSDLLILTLPLLATHELQHLTLSRRVGLTLMFSFGIIVIVAATLRFTTLGDSASGHKDILTSSYTSTVWTQVESSLAVSCACLPMQRQLLAQCIPALKERAIERSLGSFSGGNTETAGVEMRTHEGPRGWTDVPFPAERIGRAV